jgi:uncharacterized protein YggE
MLNYDEGYLMIRFLAIALSTLCTCTMLQSQETHTDQRRTIAVTGVVKMTVKPDMAEVRIGVVTEGLDVRKIKSENDRRVRAIFDALERIGIAQRNVKTTNLQISPVYDYSNGRSALIAYKMRNAVIITITDLDSVEAVINESVESGGNTVEQLVFQRSNQEQLYDSLRLEAARNARTRADAVSGALGAKVLRPISININMYPNRDYIAEALSLNAGIRPSGGTSTPISGGTLELVATVEVTFEIE